MNSNNKYPRDGSSPTCYCKTDTLDDGQIVRARDSACCTNGYCVCGFCPPSLKMLEKREKRETREQAFAKIYEVIDDLREAIKEMETL